MAYSIYSTSMLLALGGSGGDGGSGYMLWLMLLILGGIWYFVLIRPQQQQKKEHEDMVQNLEEGDRVVTAGGIHGQVKGLSEDTVKLQVAKDFKLTVNRSSIASRKNGGGEDDS